MGYHTHRVRIYYEDTDMSGLVYHANYLRYMERAREHVIGPEELVRLYEEDGIGFVVYKAKLKFKEGARLGDELEIRTTITAESEYRAIFHQSVWRPSGAKHSMVDGEIHLVCVDRDNNLAKIPDRVVQEFADR